MSPQTEQLRTLTTLTLQALALVNHYPEEEKFDLAVKIAIKCEDAARRFLDRRTDERRADLK